MKPLILILPLLVITSDVLSQRTKKKETLLTTREEWYEGSILLSIDTELKGLVRYNSHTGILSFDDGLQVKTLTPRGVIAFEFLDESTQKQRSFYTMDYADEDTGISRPMFFELLGEFKSFSVWMKADKLTITQKKNGAVYDPFRLEQNATYTDAQQIRTIFLMGNDNELEPYVRFTTKEQMEKPYWPTSAKTRTKLLGQELLAEYVTEPVYQQLKEYAKANDLRFNQEEDLMKILTYYRDNF